MGHPLLLLSPSTIVKKLLIVCAGLLLATMSGLQALSGISQSKTPENVSSALPWAGTAQAYLADQLLADQKHKPDMTQIAILAKQSLLAQAVNARAMRILGLVEDAAHHDNEALALVNLATTLSRRDVGAQLWLINKYAGADDIAAALQHYDIALRTNPEVPKTLFPVLTHALEDPDIAHSFQPYLKSDAPWVGGFIDYAISQSPHPEVLAHLAIAARGLPVTDPPHQRELALLSQLVARNNYQEAYRTFTALPGMSSKILTSTSFDKGNSAERSGVFGWQVVSTPSVGAAIVGDTPQLQIFAASGERAMVARKLLFLAPGLYRFQSRYSVGDTARGAIATWQLRCVKGAAVTPTWIRDDKAPLNSANKTVSDIPINGGCDAYYLDMNVAGGPQQSGSQFSVTSVSLSHQ